MTPATEPGILRFAIPKGRMYDGVASLLSAAGLGVRVSSRNYRPSIPIDDFEVKILKPRAIVEMLALGARDLGFAGADWVAEERADLVELLDTGLDRVRLVAAAPRDLLENGKLPERPLVVASEYEQLTRRWIAERQLDATLLHSYGATEVLPPEDADCIVDNTATGSTLRANNLDIVDELLRSTTRLYAGHKAMSDPVHRERIEHIERDPVAAASVAQVHEGRLTSGERVALKIQRPEARSQIERDLAILSMGATLLDVVPSIHLLSLPGAVERFGKALSDQLDFRLEAANNRRLTKNFEGFKGVKVPRLFDDLCTERVLAMEFIDGVKATDADKVEGRKIRRRLAARGGEAILKMVFRDGFVHADMHPGNILLQDDGTLVFIDLGMVAEIPDDLMGPWIDTFQALGANDGVAAARQFYMYAPSVGTKDYAAYERDMVTFFDRFEGKKLGEIEVSEVIGGAMNILRRHRIQIEPVFTVVNLGILVAEGVGKQLDPDLDLVAMAMPYLAEAASKAPPSRSPRRELPA